MAYKYRIVKNEHNGQVGYDPQILSYGAGYQITEHWESLVPTKHMGGTAVSTYISLICKTQEEAEDVIKKDIEEKKKWEYKQEVVAEYCSESFVQKQKGDRSYNGYQEVLSPTQRYQIWFMNNLESGMEYNPDKLPDFDDPRYVPTPTVKIVTYD